MNFTKKTSYVKNEHIQKYHFLEEKLWLILPYLQTVVTNLPVLKEILLLQCVDPVLTCQSNVPARILTCQSNVPTKVLTCQSNVPARILTCQSTYLPE